MNRDVTQRKAPGSRFQQLASCCSDSLENTLVCEGSGRDAIVHVEARSETLQNSSKPADVIGVIVRRDNSINPGDSQPVEMVEQASCRPPTIVDEVLPVRALNKNGVALTDVEEVHAEQVLRDCGRRDEKQCKGEDNGGTRKAQREMSPLGPRGSLSRKSRALACCSCRAAGSSVKRNVLSSDEDSSVASLNTSPSRASEGNQ